MGGEANQQRSVFLAPLQLAVLTIDGRLRRPARRPGPVQHLLILALQALHLLVQARESLFLIIAACRHTAPDLSSEAWIIERSCDGRVTAPSVRGGSMERRRGGLLALADADARTA